MSTKKSVYVCNVSGEEKPLEMPAMTFDKQDKAKESYAGQKDASSKSEAEEPLVMPSTLS